MLSCNSKSSSVERLIDIDGSRVKISESNGKTIITENEENTDLVPKNRLEIIGDSDNFYSIAIKKNKKNGKIVIYSIVNEIKHFGNSKEKFDVRTYKDYKSNVYYQDSVVNNPNYIFTEGNSNKY
jgi:hypothetical protein